MKWKEEEDVIDDITVVIIFIEINEGQYSNFNEDDDL